MHLFRKAREQGLSLKITSVLMIIISLVITVGLLASVIRTFRSFRALEQSTDDFIRFEEAAVDLMSASDCLTDEVQCYTVIRDRSHLENYFNEADVLRRREKAIGVIQSGMPDSPALVRLTRGMEESVRLMDREFYAMRLILEATGDPDIPKVLQDIRLSAADKALTPEEQIALAQRMVHDTDYYARKGLISRSMNECIQELKSATWQTQQAMDADTRRDLFLLTVLILIQAMATFITAWLTTHLGVNPVLQAVDSIRRDQQLPIVGASEFRSILPAPTTSCTARIKKHRKPEFPRFP